MRRVVYLLLLLFIGVPAEARVFDLELVIFAREPVDGGTELWDETVGEPDLFSGQPLLPRESDIPGLHRLGPRARKLNGIADHLRRAPGYRLLDHIAWRQDVRGSGNLPWVRIGTADPGPVRLEAASGTLPALRGIVRFTLRRYLHLELDLVHRRLLPRPVPQTLPETPVVVPLAAVPEPVATTYWHPFRLRQSRRMRSAEIHYIDHPAFGVIALATPWIPPEEAEPVLPEATLETGTAGGGDAPTGAAPTTAAPPAAATPGR